VSAIVPALFILHAAAWIVAMDWIPTPLNRNILKSTARERLPGSLIHGAVGGVLAVLAWLEWGPALYLAAGWYSLILAAAYRNWWAPYFFGIHRGEISPQDYSEHYGENARILPAFRGHPIVPDIQHMIIHAAIACAGAISIRAAVASLG
jgi:hypothetical protein